MGTVLEGVKMGPLDPDATEKFGEVNGSNSARKLIRQHQAMLPPELIRALSMKRQDQRSDQLVMGEVADALADQLPKGSKLTGCSVRGDEDGPVQYLTFTYQMPLPPEGSGRTGKGAVIYDGDVLFESHERGTRALAIKEARETGMPWTPEGGILDPQKMAAAQRAKDAADAAATDADEAEEAEDQRVEVLEDKLDDERELREQAEARAAALQEQLSALQASTVAPGGAETPTDEAPAGAAGGAAEGEDNPPEPWPGYEDAKAADLVKKIREEGNPETARLVVAYEERNGRRGTVLAAANGVLDSGAA